MTRNLPRYSAARFTWHASIHGTATASDLTREINPFGRIFNDACDIGFKLVSPRTGVEKLFIVIGEERHADDVLYWTLHEKDGPLTLTLYND